MKIVDIDSLLAKVLKAYDTPFSSMPEKQYILSKTEISEDGSVKLIGTIQVKALWDEIESVDQGRTEFPFTITIALDGKIKLILPDEISVEHSKTMEETYERIEDFPNDLKDGTV
ncbi:hypothetical protein KAX21_07220 [candidate division WOR-3 bacterium]|nr:hypothetical protein [candidate division WOR-3 bacterium]